MLSWKKIRLSSRWFKKSKLSVTDERIGTDRLPPGGLFWNSKGLFWLVFASMIVSAIFFFGLSRFALGRFGQFGGSFRPDFFPTLGYSYLRSIDIYEAT